MDKVLFIGLGGAGQRHLRILNDKLGSGTRYLTHRSTRHTPVLNADFSVNAEATLEDLYSVEDYPQMSDAFAENPDLCVISTPSSLHMDTAVLAAENGADILIEKPLSHELDGIDRLHELVVAGNLRFLVSFQRRFHPLIARVRALIAAGRLGKIVNAVFTVASYVPHWHPYEDFRQLYACRADLGGGVLLTEIHELDLCRWFFGSPERVACVGGSYSSYGLDVEDTVHVSLDYGGFGAQVNLSFMQQTPRRDFFIEGEDGYVAWNQDGNRLTFRDYKNGDHEDLADPDFQNDDMFIAQADHFLNHFDPATSGAGVMDSWASVAMVEAAKESMRTGAFVTPRAFPSCGEIK